MKFLHIEDSTYDLHRQWAMRLTERMGKEYMRIDADMLTATADADGFSQWLQDEGVGFDFHLGRMQQTDYSAVSQRLQKLAYSVRFSYGQHA